MESAHGRRELDVCMRGVEDGESVLGGIPHWGVDGTRLDTIEPEADPVLEHAR